MKNLFGEDVALIAPEKRRVLGKYQAYKTRNHYRKTSDKRIRCDKCYHLAGHCRDKNYYKCRLMGCSYSEASDIRLSYVCDNFKER